MYIFVYVWLYVQYLHPSAHMQNALGCMSSIESPFASQVRLQRLHPGVLMAQLLHYNTIPVGMD